MITFSFLIKYYEGMNNGKAKDVKFGDDARQLIAKGVNDSQMQLRSLWALTAAMF